MAFVAQERHTFKVSSLQLNLSSQFRAALSEGAKGICSSLPCLCVLFLYFPLCFRSTSSSPSCANMNHRSGAIDEAPCITTGCQSPQRCVFECNGPTPPTAVSVFPQSKKDLTNSSYIQRMTLSHTPRCADDAHGAEESTRVCVQEGSPLPANQCCPHNQCVATTNNTPSRTTTPAQKVKDMRTHSISSSPPLRGANLSSAGIPFLMSKY